MPKFQSLFDLQKIFADEQDCLKYLEKHRWKGLIASPFDPNSKVYKYANSRYRCKKTSKYFNVKLELSLKTAKSLYENGFMFFIFL